MKLRHLQFIAAVGLSLLFVGVYGGCNFITSLRDDVQVIYFDWERHIPFVPWLIVPYMSIDLFFVGAPFLCGDRHELGVFAKRIVAGILISGVCFLLLPLTLAHERPQVDGLFGPVFAFLHGFDAPYNLLPSMHIILRTILAQKYGQKTRGSLHGLVHFWFFLIGLSTLLVYQHHVIDVVGGFVTAVAIIYFIPAEPHAKRLVPNPRVGAYYLLAALLLAAAAMSAPPWTLLLAWPAASIAVVASAYVALGPSITVKRRGRIPLGAWLVLWPWLWGQGLSRRYYMRQCRAWDELTPRVWIGRQLSDAEARDAVDRGVCAVLDMTCEFSEARAFLDTDYHNLQVLDLTAPPLDALDEAADFIEASQQRGAVYVHCKIGYSRSAAAVLAWLLKTGRAAGVEDAVAALRAVRSRVVIRPEIHRALADYAAQRGRLA